jgi:hypothetical protein
VTFDMTVSDLDQAPGPVAVKVFEAGVSATATFTYDGVGSSIYVTTTDETGGLDTDVMLPEISAGTHTLHLTVGADTVNVDFEVASAPLDWSSDAGDVATDPDLPTFVPSNRWQLVDPLTDDVYTFPRNPVSWNGPPERTIYYHHDAAVAPGGRILSWAEAGRAWPMEFAGRTFTQGEYQDLQEWSAKRYRFWLVDHRETTWLVTFTQFDARARIDRSVGVWSHDYTMKTLIFNKPVTGAFGWDDTP